MVFIELTAPSQELSLVGRNFKFVEYSIHRADWLTVRTIDTYFRVNEIHFFGFGCRDASDRTNFQAGSILNSYTGFGDYKTQSISLFANDEVLSHLIKLLKSKEVCSSAGIKWP